MPPCATGPPPRNDQPADAPTAVMEAVRSFFRAMPDAMLTTLQGGPSSAAVSSDAAATAPNAAARKFTAQDLKAGKAMWMRQADAFDKLWLPPYRGEHS
jgi:hypothetical protein